MRPASRPARPASTSRRSSAASVKTTCAAQPRRSSRPTCSAACARACARPRCCASRPACATRMKTSRSRSACCSGMRPTRCSPRTARRCSRAHRRPASASRSSAPGRPACRAPPAPRCSAMTCPCSRRSPAPAAGKRVAVGGAGPAGLSCAHRAALLGHDVTVFEAKPKPGGLNEYGLATYKTPDDFAQKEIAWLLSIGGITVRCGQALGEQITLANLAAEYDAVFLGIGLGGVNALGLADETLGGVGDAVAFIAGLRQASDYAAVPVGRRVIVIGGGMTAIDAAVQSKKLGAQEVTIVYRRDQQRMPASKHEQEWAQMNGVTIRTFSVLKSLEHALGQVQGATFAEVREIGGRLEVTGRQWTIAADTVLKAIGQTLVLADPSVQTLALQAGRISVDAEGRTSLANVWAGGDCTYGGRDLTVEAVEHGKIAAQAIDRAFGMQRDGTPFTRVRKTANV